MTRQGGGELRFAGTVSEPATVTVAGKPATVSGTNAFSAEVATTVGTNRVAVTATDPSGNMATGTYEVDITENAKSFTYDANGNLTSEGTRTFEWDARNQVVAVTAGTHRSEFTYSGLQQRVRMVEKENGVTQADAKLVWCESEICEERAADCTSVTRRVFGVGEQVAESARFFATDHVESVTEVADASATVLGRYAFDPWGRRTLTAGSDVTTAGYTRHGWRSSGEISLTLYRAYEPTLGRWLSDDPAGLVDGVHRYSYVGNRPIVRIDSLGLQGTSPGGMNRGTKNGIEAAWLSCLNKGDRRVYWKETPFNPVVRQEEWRKWKGDFGAGCREKPSPGYSRYYTCAIGFGFKAPAGLCVCCENCTPN